MKSICLAFLFLFSISSFSVESFLKILMNSGNPNEIKAKNLLEGLVKTHNLKPYIFSRDILIQSMVIPQSHPVLTLNTRFINDPDRLLDQLLHEEMHWFFNDEKRVGKINGFISKMESKYATPPNEENGGASNARSTYLHLGVCYYELIALSTLLGPEKAEQIFKTEKVYSWIRNKVQTDREYIQKALIESGINWEDADAK